MKRVRVVSGDLCSFEDRELLVFLTGKAADLLHPVRGVEVRHGKCILMSGPGFRADAAASLQAAEALDLTTLTRLVSAAPAHYGVYLKFDQSGKEHELGLVAKGFAGKSAFAHLYTGD